MAFFSNSKSHDSQLRRKRSTSTTKDRPSRQSTDDKSTNETPYHKRSPRISVSPSTSAITPEPHDPTPPLPSPMTAESGSRSRTVSTRNGSPSSYDQSSTPIPFPKPTKRTSPPPFSNLIINVPSAAGSEHASSPRAKVNHPETRSTTSNRTAPSSPSALYPIPNSNPVKQALVPSEEFYSGIISPSMPCVERQRPPSSQRIAAILPLKLPHSPTPTPNSDTGPSALPTPVSPPQRRRTVRPDPISIPPTSPGRSHSRSQSATNSPTAYAHGSGPGSAKSSARRFPPMVNLDIGEASRPGSASASGKSTPPHETAPGKPREKRTRNVLRKPSITRGNQGRQPESAPASDNERQTNKYRPRSRSVLPSRHGSGPIPDISQPLPPIPVTVVDLTPAKGILVAYKESHRAEFSQDMPLHNSGNVVGIEEDNNVSSLNMKVGRKDERGVEEREAGEKTGSGIRIFKRKLSGKWSGKESSRRRDDPTRSVSESAVEVSEKKLTRNTEGKRSMTVSNDTRPSASPTNGQSPGRGRRLNHDGRVWEDTGNYTESEEKGVSNSRGLWKLVKRLSSGNLRGKASPPLEPLPPVPPLPRDLSRKRDLSPSEAYDFHADEMPIPPSAVPETAGGIRRFISSVPSLSIPRSATGAGLEVKQTSFHHHRSDLAFGAGMSPVSSQMNATHHSVTATTPTGIQMRRPATTRSSSPSSETTKFFSPSRSSSSSSYDDGLAPPVPSMPPSHAGMHTPSPLKRHSSQNDREEDTAATEHFLSALKLTSSAPSSPRTSDETSATIPPFEAHHPVNTFLPYRGLTQLSPCTTSNFPDHEPITRTQQAKPTNPPPIPKRNPRRPGHHSVSIPSLPAQQYSKPNVIPVQDSSESEGSHVLRSERRFDSGQRPTIPKPRPRSTSDGALTPELERYINTANSAITFREMTTTQRQLTEQERNAKWEALLQRSDKAGGTLHVGSPISGSLGLWSDRSSVALSVAPSETLDSTD